MQKVVLITGVSSGLGHAVSGILASNNYIVYGTIRDKSEVPAGVIPIHMELTNPDTISNAIQQIIDDRGRIDVLINNAGMHSGGPLEEMTSEVYRRQFETNVFGWLKLIQEVLPHMRKRNDGLIINISSIGGLTGLPFQGIYSSVKFAIEGLSQALRAELRQFNVRVVVVNPGDFRTRNTETRVICLNKDSDYTTQFHKSLKCIENDEFGGMPPDYLAHKLLKIIASRKPRNRYIIASPIQRLACIVRKLIPESYFAKIIASHYDIR